MHSEIVLGISWLAIQRQSKTNQRQTTRWHLPRQANQRRTNRPGERKLGAEKARFKGGQGALLRLARQSEAEQDKSEASRTDAGGKARNQIAASKQVLGRRRQQEAAKAGKETAAFAVSNWVSGY